MSYKYDGAGMSPEAFQEIIKERKAEMREKAETKRFNDLQCIQEMKSKSGVHPLNIFPKEIWQLIFNELSPEDRGNVWEVHDEFQSIMQTSRIRDILLPQIVKLKIKNCWIEDCKKGEIPFAHYLKLREVSNTMRNAVDQFLENDLMNHLPPANTTNNKLGRLKTTTFLIRFCHFQKDITKLDRLCSDSSNSRHFHRHATRSLKIQIFDCGDPVLLQDFEHLKHNFFAYLRLVGENIWHFEFECSHLFRIDKRNGMNYAYILFVACLSLLPHLRWFKLNISCSRPSGCNCKNVPHTLLQNHPPPQLMNLQRIDLGEEIEDVSSWVTVQVYKAILAAYPNVRHLLMMRGDDVLPSNETLQLESFHLKEPFLLQDCLENNFFVLEKMVHVSWPLQRLKMRIDLYEDSIIPVFKFLEKFPSLEQVSLDIRNVHIGGGIDFLTLPNLQELDLTFLAGIVTKAPTHFFFSLQFLIYCRRLRELRWHDESSDREYAERLQEISKRLKNNLIAFEGGRGNLNYKQNNVWRIFPHLEYIKVYVSDKGEDGQWRSCIWEDRRNELKELGEVDDGDDDDEEVDDNDNEGEKNMVSIFDK